jgi:hypothetical protein
MSGKVLQILSLEFSSKASLDDDQMHHLDYLGFDTTSRLAALMGRWYTLWFGVKKVSLWLAAFYSTVRPC